MNHNDLKEELIKAEKEAKKVLSAPVSHAEFKRGQLLEDEAVVKEPKMALRDRFAMAFAASGHGPSRVYKLADEALAHRDD